MRQLATEALGAVRSAETVLVFSSEATTGGAAVAPLGSAVVTMTAMTATGEGETAARSALWVPAGLSEGGGEGARGGTGGTCGALHAGSGARARENASVSVAVSGRSWPWRGGAASSSSQAPPGCGASPCG